jgi:hypothetical protein
LDTFCVVEFMYRPRPSDPRARAVFDYTLRARLSAVTPDDAVILLCNDQAAADSLQPLIERFPHLLIFTFFTPPMPPLDAERPPYVDAWEHPARWRRVAMTDRWLRILHALDLGRGAIRDYLVMPAHDAVYSRALLEQMAHSSHAHVQGQMPALVSPITPHIHHPVPGADISPAIIDLHNAVFDRAPLRQSSEGQGFWGKLGMIPWQLCEPIRAQVDTTTWEDDLEIDRVVNEMGYAAVSIPIEDPALYHQAPPIFTREDVRRVIDRTLHYSLKIPGEKRSALHAPHSPQGIERARHDAAFAQALHEADAMIAACEADMRARVAQHTASWVDWGGYRCVATPSAPSVAVWSAR